ncbi:MAG: hypothetical protein C0606_11185 [Hyphomicrobiales bacterium]|nr:MAG: hypothetical protein C0606_11185 [Hyphomicrobiales bacterium]
MGKPKPRAGRSRRDTKHVRLHEWMMRTEAWKSLKPATRVVYTELGRLYNGTNNGMIGASVRRLAIAANCDKSTVSRSLKELIAKGFVEITTPSAFSRKDRIATEYRLTEHACNLTNQPAKKTFARWSQKKQQSEKSSPQSDPRNCDPNNSNGTNAHGPEYATARLTCSPTTVAPDGHY